MMGPMPESQRSPWLLALGAEGPQPTIRLASGRRLELAQTFKHDFFAHTARYEDDAGSVLIKQARRRHAFYVPLFWVGWLITWNEARVFRRLAGLAGIPALHDTGDRGILAHDFLPGRALAWGEPTPDGFLELLEQLVERIHARNVAVVDLEKPGNVLLGSDGQPALFDFQLSWYWPRVLGGGLPPFTWILRAAQTGDRYHVTKLRRRLRPDTMTPDEIEASRQRPGLVGFITKSLDPLRRLRRRYLRRVEGEDTKPGERGRVTR